VSPTKRRLIITLVTLLLVALVPAAVMAAGGTFTDDDDSIFETHIEWLAASGVTAGCNPPTNDHFCPDDNVTRGQMAAFMRRFAQYLGAEDGTPAVADHALTADSATAADEAAYAANAGTVDGKNAIDFQPTTFDFDTGDYSVNSNDDHEIVEATVTTNSGALFLCFVGQSATADIRIHASGNVESLGAGEQATFVLYDDDGQIPGTIRRVAENQGSFAIEWLYELVPGGTETFTLVSPEIGGDTFFVNDAVITAEVISETRCKGSIAIFPSEPTDVHPDSTDF